MPNFPLSLDDNVSLYLAVNNLRTRLTSAIDSSTLTIPVVTTSGFPNNGFLTILSDPNDITKAEAVRYEGYTLTTFSGVERGAAGTPALSHNTSDNVDLTVVADHHNELKDAIIEIEKFLGVSGSENFVPFAGGNNVLLPAGLSVQNNLTVSGAGGFSGGLTVSGVPVTTGTYAIVNELSGNVVISGAGNVTVTEEGQVVVVSGSAAAGAAAGGPIDGVVVFSTTETLSSPGDLTITVPQTADHLEIIFQGRSTVNPGTGAILGLRINGDTGSNYNSTLHRVNESAVNQNSGTDGQNVSQISAGVIPGNTSPNADDPGTVRLYLPDYRVTSKHKSLSGHTYANIFDSQVGIAGGTWENTAAVTSLTFRDADGVSNLTTGSTVTIIGYSKEGQGGILTVKEQDGVPTVSGVQTIVVPNDSLTDDGSGQITLDFATGGSGSATPADYALITLTSNQTTNINAADHVEFDSVVSGTSGIVLSAGAGQASGKITLPEDKVFVLVGDMSVDGTSGVDVTHKWRDITNGIDLGVFGRTVADSSTGVRQDQARAVVDTSVTGEIQVVLEIDSEFFLTSIRGNPGAGGASTYGMVYELTGQGGGGSSFDPSQNQTITGDWDFTESLTVSGNAINLNNDHGNLTGLSDDDHPQYGHVSQNEIVPGLWDFENGLTISGVAIPLTGGGGGVTDHGALTGLADNDHPQYSRIATNETISGLWDFENGLTISGVAVPLTGGGGGVTDHGALTGLSDDDHTQYLLVDGSRALGGDLNLGSNDITNVTNATISTSLTVSGSPAMIDITKTVTSVWDFDSGLTVSGIAVPLTSSGVTDHGDLNGLGDNDHPQYSRIATDESITGNWNFPNGATVSGSPVLTSDSAVGGGGNFTTISGMRYIVRKFDTTHSPVALYNFEYDLTDDSGNGLDLTAANSSLMDYHEYKGLTFVATDTALEENTQAASLRITGDLTVEMIVWNTALLGDGSSNSRRWVVHQGANFPDNEVENVLYSFFHGSDGSIQLFHENGAGSNNQFDVSDRLVVPEGVHVLGFTRTSDVYQFYLDGKPYGAASSALNTPTGGSSGRLRLCSEQGATSQALHIASCKIINSALTQTQMKAEYDNITEPFWFQL